MSKEPIDWQSVEREYRIGLRSLKDIGAEFGVSDAGIIKRAKRDGWVRDRSKKIMAKAEALVSEKEVSAKVSAQTKITERQIVETNAQMIAEKVISQREDVKRARSIVQKLFAEVEAECDHKEDFANIGELLADPDANGRDRLNDLYRAAISLPERVKSAKALSEALKTLIELERKVLRISDAPEQVNSTVTLKADATLPPSDAYKHMLGMA